MNYQIKSKSRLVFLFIGLVILSFILFVLNIAWGYENISLRDIFISFFFDPNDSSTASFIIQEIRLPRATIAVISGIALSISGLQMQTIFRNPLADPYILGVSAGAGLGVAMLTLGFQIVSFSYFYQFSIVMAAIIGSLSVVFIMAMLAHRVKDIMTVLVLGILINGIVASFISILQYIGSESSVKLFVLWSMGSLSSVTFSQIKILIPFVAVGLGMALYLAKPLNAIEIGDTFSKSIGVKLKQTRILVFISAGILSGGVTALCGPIGFIGIIVPHLARLITRTSNKLTLLLFSAIIGTNVMLVSDIISNLPFARNILPISAVTSMIGIPIVIWLVLKNNKLSEKF